VHLTWLGSKTLTDHMYFGGMPGARNELLPLHAMSYEGSSPKFAGLVINDTREALRWIGYNFGSKTMSKARSKRPRSRASGS